jgi:hypothetical protein
VGHSLRQARSEGGAKGGRRGGEGKGVFDVRNGEEVGSKDERGDGANEAQSHLTPDVATYEEEDVENELRLESLQELVVRPSRIGDGLRRGGEDGRVEEVPEEVEDELNGLVVLLGALAEGTFEHADEDREDTGLEEVALVRGEGPGLDQGVLAESHLLLDGALLDLPALGVDVQHPGPLPHHRHGLGEDHAEFADGEHGVGVVALGHGDGKQLLREHLPRGELVGEGADVVIVRSESSLQVLQPVQAVSDGDEGGFPGLGTGNVGTEDAARLGGMGCGEGVGGRWRGE